jgi:hypothetical protein
MRPGRKQIVNLKIPYGIVGLEKEEPVRFLRFSFLAGAIKCP